MKPTLSTIKSFIRKNQAVLHIKNLSDFDGMVDCVMPVNGAGFKPVKPTNGNLENNLGIAGAWFVKRSRDYFEPYQDDDFRGFRVYNSCGSFILAIPTKMNCSYCNDSGFCDCLDCQEVLDAGHTPATCTACSAIIKHDLDYECVWCHARWWEGDKPEHTKECHANALIWHK